MQTPLPEHPQLLPHRPWSAADVGYNLFLVLDVLKDLLWIVAFSLFFTNIIVWVTDSPAHTPREEKQNKLFPANCWFAQDPRGLTWPYCFKVDEQFGRFPHVPTMSLFLSTACCSIVNCPHSPHKSQASLWAFPAIQLVHHASKTLSYFSKTKCCLNISSKSI